jgi:hypothetical protein
MVDRNTMIAWLNDAYAMESALIPILQNHASDVQDDPPARERIAVHIEQRSWVPVVSALRRTVGDGVRLQAGP